MLNSHSFLVRLLAVSAFFLASFHHAYSQEPAAEPAVEPEVADGSPEEALPEETPEAAIADEEAEPKKEPKQRTPMSMPTYAPFGESQRGMPAMVNPSFPSLSERRSRFGTILDFGFGAEIGDTDDDFVEDVSDLIIDEFEALEEDLAALRAIEQTAPGRSTRDDEVNAFLDLLEAFETRANDLVNELASSAYVKLSGSLSLPFTPIAVRSDTLGGMLSVTADGILETRGAVFSSGDAFATGLSGIDASQVVGFEQVDGTEVVVLTGGERRPLEATSDAGVAVQGGAVGRVGTGYSRNFVNSDQGRFQAGTTVNFYHATLVRTGILFDEDEFGDAAEDAFEEDDETSNGFGVDLGAAWVAKNYLVGGVVRNINEPSFDYPDTSASPFFIANPRARRNGDEWTMERQFTLQGATYTADQRWILSGAVDLNSAADVTGDDYQWASVIGSFEPRRTWAPSPRLGLRQNLVGEELTYVTVGLSFFRALHLDISTTLDTVEVDGQTVPRGFQANLALGRRF